MPEERRVHLRDGDVHLADVRCLDPPRRWSEVRPAPVFGLVLLRHGLLRSRVEGRETLLDPASVYVERLGTEQQFAHPCGPDTFTEVVLSEPRVASMLGGDPSVPEGTAMITPPLALAHRRLLGRARAGADAFELSELTITLVNDVFTQLAPARTMSGRPRTAAARQRLANDARALLADDPTLGLNALSRAVGASPHHLSRVFSHVTGVTLTGYRHRLRLARALERLAEGEDDLALLAHELGFSDQAHMTRLLRRATGLPPGKLRALLGPQGGRVRRPAGSR